MQQSGMLRHAHPIDRALMELTMQWRLASYLRNICVPLLTPGELTYWTGQLIHAGLAEKQTFPERGLGVAYRLTPEGQCAQHQLMHNLELV
jgi:hypothetical protein